MSLARTSASKRYMRIIALPLTRPQLRKTPTRKESSSYPTGKSGPEENDQRAEDAVLTYYHFQITQKPASTGGLVNWVSSKAASVWARFGKAPEGSWKYRIFQYGERLVDRIDFEELALKGVDPSLGPSILRPYSSRLDQRTGTGSEKGPNGGQYQPLMIPLVHPSRTLSGVAALRQLRTLLEQRVPRHRRGFWGWMAVAPLTTPLIVIPVIPNLPFFFCAWRSWSHYRAYRASQYLETLVESGCVVPEGSEELEELYRRHSGLITRDAVPEVVRVLGLDTSTSGELYRAIEQARIRTRIDQ